MRKEFTPTASSSRYYCIRNPDPLSVAATPSRSANSPLDPSRRLPFKVQARGQHLH